MSPDDFSAMGRALFSKGWQTRLAEKLEVDGSTIRRWVGSGMSVPPTASAFLSMMAERQATRGALVYARQPVGSPVRCICDDQVTELEKLRKPLRFPGVPDHKRLPSIHSEMLDGELRIALADLINDSIETTDMSFVLTRHPDPYHLSGYRNSALSAGHETTVIRYGDHFYSLLAHRAGPVPLVLHHIATHAGVNRILWSASRDPKTVLREELN